MFLGYPLSRNIKHDQCNVLQAWLTTTRRGGNGDTSHPHPWRTGRVWVSVVDTAIQGDRALLPTEVRHLIVKHVAYQTRTRRE